MSEGHGARRLRFREMLGRGSFGTVFAGDLSSAQGLHRRVAIKLLNVEGTEAAELEARHRDEARLLALLNHEHIVKVYDLIKVEGRLAFMLEYVEGVSAEHLVVGAGPLPPRAVMTIGAAVAGALEAAYNAQSPTTHRALHVIHRDIKPANILISVGGGVKVLDFGVARADFDRDARTHTLPPGTAVYMAPECFTGAPVGAALDVYALALTLIRLLTKLDIERLVASEERYTPQRDALLAKVEQRLAPGPWRDELIALLCQMLAWEASARPTGAELQDALMALEDGAPGERLIPFSRRAIPPLVEGLRAQGRGSSISLPTELTLTADDDVQPSSLPSRPAKPTSVWRLAMGWLAGGALVGLVVLVGIGALLYFGLREPATIADTPAAPVAEPVVVNTVRQKAPTPTAQEPVPTTTREEPAQASPHGSARAKPPATSSTQKTTTPSAAAAPTWELTFSSRPFGARILLDGKYIGETPMIKYKLGAGSHRLQLELPDGSTASRTIEVGQDHPTRFTWTAETGSWSLEL